MRLQVLVVDDDDAVRESLFDELRDEYDVDTVSCGEDAIDKIRDHRYDAVISDLRMPGIDGLEVLQQVRERDPDAVRILLTGYLDERARANTMQPGAPYKIGKPWRDDLRVTLRRALEHNERERALAGSVSDALSVAAINDELSRCEGAQNIATVLARRAREIRGVRSFAVILSSEGTVRTLAAFEDRGPHTWRLTLPIDPDAGLEVRARGEGATSEQIFRFMVVTAARWCEADSVTRLVRRATAHSDSGERLAAMSRRASIGTMTGALIHEIAGIVQILQMHLTELDDGVRQKFAPESYTVESLDAMGVASERMMSLFDALRRFVRQGLSSRRLCSVNELLRSACALCAGYVRTRAQLRVSEAMDVAVEINEPLMLQVLVNLIRNAADASPRNGFVDVEARRQGDQVVISVIDDGDGVPEEIRETVFEPFFTTKENDGGSGLGLAISAQVVQDHGGEIHCDNTVARGARFTVALPLGC